LNNGFGTSTLFVRPFVGRIATVYPREEVQTLEQELGYRDRFMVTGEYLHLFDIQAAEFVGEKLRQLKQRLPVHMDQF